jgi:hypothetical protein
VIRGAYSQQRRSDDVEPKLYQNGYKSVPIILTHRLRFA